MDWFGFQAIFVTTAILQVLCRHAFLKPDPKSAFLRSERQADERCAALSKQQSTARAIRSHARVQLCAAAILVLLLPLVPRVEAGLAAPPGAQAAAALVAAEAATAADDGLAAVRVPLLLSTPCGRQSEEA